MNEILILSKKSEVTTIFVRIVSSIHRIALSPAIIFSVQSLKHFTKLIRFRVVLIKLENNEMVGYNPPHFITGFWIQKAQAWDKQ